MKSVQFSQGIPDLTANQFSYYKASFRRSIHQCFYALTRTSGGPNTTRYAFGGYLRQQKVTALYIKDHGDLKNVELVTCTINNQLTKIVDGKIVDRVVIINPEQYADISDMVCSHGFIWILAHIGSKGVQLFRFTEDLKQRKKFQVHTEDITTDMHSLKILYISEAKTYLQFVDRYNNILITAIVS